VRIGLHTGAADARAGDYFGPALNRVGRIMAAGHGGQILLSLATQELVRDQLPADITLRDMGERRLRDLIRPERLFQVLAPDLPESFPPLRTLDYRPNNLPAQTTSFVGREADLSEVRRTLLQPQVRLLTLTGPGGMGKTRLALQAAADLLDDFEQGVFFVPLASLDSPDQVVPAIAQTLGAVPLGGGGIADRLKSYLREKQLLLVLDNFEHLLDAGPAVLELLAAAPQLKLLVTSRALLRLSGEHDYSVPPLLELPDPARLPTLEQLTQYAAVQLFIERARALQADFTVTNENAAAVAEICYRLDGLPLAIELAAAWSEMLRPEEILAELDRSLDFLETDLRDIPERHRSLRAVFDYSWDLLTPAEQGVFRQLAVFRGGFPRQAAQAVTGATLVDLRGLVGKSLLRLTPAGRYEIHELLRQYAAERLEQAAEASAAHDRHCAFHIHLLHEWAQGFADARQKGVMQAMRSDGDNARAAWAWALEHRQVDRLAQGLEGLIRMHAVAGRIQEALAACQSLVWAQDVRSAEAVRLAVNALLWECYMSRLAGQRYRISPLLDQAQTLLENPLLAGLDLRTEEGFWLTERAEVDFPVNRPEARRLYQRALALFQEQGNLLWVAYLLFRLADAAWLDGDYAGARELSEQCLALRRQLGAPRQISQSLLHLCYTDMYQGNLAEAERLAQEWLAIARELADQPSIGNAHSSLGEIALWRGDFAKASALFVQSVAIWSELGLSAGIPSDCIFDQLAQTQLGSYDLTLAQELLVEMRRVQLPYYIGYGLLCVGSVALAMGQYDAARAALEEGAELLGGAQQRNGQGQLLSVLALLDLKEGRPAAARKHLATALQIVVETGAYQPRLFAVPAAALLLAQAGQAARAVEVYALACAHDPFVANSRWIEEMVGRDVAAAAETLPPEETAAARERGRAREMGPALEELWAEVNDAIDLAGLTRPELVPDS
jgi:predicted ATPase